MITVILPTYNEERGLASLIPKIARAMAAHGFDYRILVVDDGSTDGSAEVARGMARTIPITVLSHTINRGLWETIRDGFEWAAAVSAPDDIIVRMDADDTHDPMLIVAMVKALNEHGGAEVVVASRFAPGGGMIGVSRYRQIVSWGASLVMRAVFPYPGVRDYSCGYRAYRASAIQDALAVFGNAFVDLRGVGFTCTVEKLLKLRLVGARAREVPLVLRYDQKESPSKMLSGITTLGYGVLILKNIYPWGEHGKVWRRAAGEVRRRRERERNDD